MIDSVPDGVDDAEQDDEILRSHVEQALEQSDDSEVRYHLREALQLLNA